MAKLVACTAEAVAQVGGGASLLVGGFGVCGIPSGDPKFEGTVNVCAVPS